MKTHLRTIAAALLPAAALLAGAMSHEARAQAPVQSIAAADEPIATFVGQPAYDENGVLLGTIHEVIVDNAAAGAPATAVVTRADGETLALPLGPSKAVATLVTAQEFLAMAQVVTPVLIGPDFSPESRGS